MAMMLPDAAADDDKMFLLNKTMRRNSSPISINTVRESTNVSLCILQLPPCNRVFFFFFSFAPVTESTKQRRQGVCGYISDR